MASLNPFSNPQVTRRFIVLMAIATFVMFSIWAVVKSYTQTPLGDYEVRQGDIFLSDEKYDDALERFNAALSVSPTHRGAMMGRALSFMLSGRTQEAETELTNLIDFLKGNLEADDRTGTGTLAAAYNNRAILLDRQCRHKEALADYIAALTTDEVAVKGPGLIDKILYSANPSTPLKRAQFLHQRIDTLKEGECLLMPEKDAEERVYKP
ncbi:MAG: tetratricopeptide repeat protein [Rhodospirillaceae bacterium]|nr:tetratricopeptide repeat protein [Rhodospirillaceae bacterium]MBL6941716.1 tetratricopeptide repeat protein [Rhodospirillales bacterium]